MYDLRHAGYEPYHTMGVSELCLSRCTVIVLSERTVNTKCFWSYTTLSINLTQLNQLIDYSLLMRTKA